MERILLTPSSSFIPRQSSVFTHHSAHKPTIQDGALFFPKTPTTIMCSVGGEDPIAQWILTEGKANKITQISPVGGGCINVAYRYQTDSGSFFVKKNRSIGKAMFEGESLGLRSMHSTNTIRVPQPFKVGELPGGGSYIIMEFIEFGSSTSRGGQDSQSVLAESLGRCIKPESLKEDLVLLFKIPLGEHRLGYQLNLALEKFGDSAIFEKGLRLTKNMRPLFEGVLIEPCLLHGDLWSGNISCDENGEPVILDPACYYGHNEAEFGMSWCAGFGASFYNSYFQVMPKQVGFHTRKDLYKLYHYLNHYNLFGSGYRSSAMSIIDDYLRMLRV